MYLKAPTFLYHETIAPKGKLFPASAERPIPHPGPEWADTPFPDADEGLSEGDAERIVSAERERTEAVSKNGRLVEELSEALDRAESAEATCERLTADLAKERADHAATKAKLAEASAENDRLNLAVQDRDAKLNSDDFKARKTARA